MKRGLQVHLGVFVTLRKTAIRQRVAYQPFVDIILRDSSSGFNRGVYKYFTRASAGVLQVLNHVATFDLGISVVKDSESEGSPTASPAFLSELPLMALLSQPL